MAVSNPCPQTEWDEWRREMEENRRIRLRERLKRWGAVRLSDEEEEGEEDYFNWDEEEVSEESDVEEEEEEEGKDEDEGGSAERREVEEIEKVDGEAEDGVDLEEEVEEHREDWDMVEAGWMEEELIRVAVSDEESEWEVGVNGEGGGGEEVIETEEVGREEKEKETEEDGGVKENWEEEEEEEMTETEGGQEREREGTGEVEETEEQQKRAGEGESELDVEVTVNGEGEEREDWQFGEDDQDVEEEEDEEEEFQIGQLLLQDQLQEESRRTERQDLQQNPDGTMQESRRVHKEPNSSAKSSCDESNLIGSDEGGSKSERTNSERGDVSKHHKELEALHSTKVEGFRKEGRRSEDTGRKLRRESFLDVHEQLQEEEGESTEDEDAENSAEEEADDYDEDLVKVYSKDDYLADLFHTLAEFRYLSLLTDLTLSTEDGASFNVHSLVLASVSSLIRDALSRADVGKERSDDDTRAGVSKWPLPLGSEVDRLGLEAVVEFAYTGHVSFLREDTVYQIKAAAQTMGAPRVLDLCLLKEEKSTKTGGRKEEEGVSAEDQLEMSLESMKQLWRSRVGCDVILEAVEGSLHVHRVILAVGSDYFRSMFTLGMKESHQPSVALPFLSASELEVLVSCSYSGTLPISWKCVFELTITALQLQYQPALHLCLNFLQQEINPHSCLDVASFAKAFEMTQLLEVADDYVLRQFQKVARTSKFKDLPAKQLLMYLDSHSLCVPSELVVFKAVVAWIQAKPKRRLKLARRLMKTIQFPLMTFKEFKEVQSLNMWSDHSLAELFEAIFEDFCANDIAPQTHCRIYLPKESLVLIGGDQTSEDFGRRSVSGELWFGNSLRNHTGVVRSTEWRKLGEMPDTGRFRHEVAVLKGQLYVFGGKKYYGIRDTLDSVYRYDPLQNTWESLAKMQEPRSAFSVVLLDGKMLAIGGQCEPDYRESVEQYCPTANSWRFMWPLDLPLSGHVAKVLRGQIYVSGGLNSGYQCFSSMFLYHPETGSTYLANMAHPRAYHCMEALGDYLYVAGGISTDKNMTVFDQLDCEVYSPANDSWTAFTPQPVPHVGAGSAVLEGKFYVLGGYSQEDYSDTKRIHRYDPSTQRWENMGRMPGPNNDIRATLLCLPKHFRT